MEWDKGYSSAYYVMELNPETWAETGRFEITGGSIRKTLDGLRQSADLNCKDYSKNKEQWVRIYLDARQSDSGAHIALFTGLATSPERDVKGTWFENTVQCYSVLKPASDIYLKLGWYAPAGISCSSILRELLEPVPAPIEFETEAPALTSTLIAESGETNLTMVEKILSAINWNMRIAGDGTITFGEYSETPKYLFSSIEFDVIETEIRISRDWYSCPNVIMIVNNDETITVKDENPDSPLSVQNRGREVWMYENGYALNENETAEDYARRRLKEAQEYVTTASYDRRFVPDLLPGDMVNLHYIDQDLDGEFLITSQSIELSYGARTSEEVVGVNDEF